MLAIDGDSKPWLAVLSTAFEKYSLSQTTSYNCYYRIAPHLAKSKHAMIQDTARREFITDDKNPKTMGDGPRRVQRIRLNLYFPGKITLDTVFYCGHTCCF